MAEIERLHKLAEDQDSVVRRQRGRRLEQDAEIERLRAENERLHDEIERLREAVRALAASLAWNCFGECRAWGTEAILSPAEDLARRVLRGRWHGPDDRLRAAVP